jgi:two-component system chemotaxis response regulator CheY
MALVVDDSALTRQVVAYVLREAGFDVLEAENGAAALTALDGRSAQLIVTDLHMPVMDGIAFVKAVRALGNCRGTPIVVLTTEAEERRKREGRAAGASAWIVKPVTAGELLRVVETLCP